MFEEENMDEVVDADEDDTIIDLITYDIGLPLEHRYLSGLSIVDGRKIYAPGTKIRLPLIFMDGIILIPGQEVPFTFRHQDSVQFFRRIISGESQTFGMGYDRHFGTSAEIRSYSLQDDMVTIKAEGRQRFKIVSKKREFFETYNALVEIQPEINMKSYFQPFLYNENKKFLLNKANITSIPHFLFTLYDDSVLMKRLTSILENIIEPQVKNKDFTYPTEANAFSYFVLSAFPFSDEIKVKLLQLNCTTHRLRAEHALLNLPFTVRCGHCKSKMCEKDDFLVMSKRGTNGTFVNPSGCIHELFTFSKALNVVPVGELNFEYSWFPNYGWIITRFVYWNLICNFTLMIF